MTEGGFTVRDVTMADRSRLANLIHFGSFIHQHLDWKAPLDWIGSDPYILLEKESNLYATLACPPELPEVVWIRLFAVNNLMAARDAWELLWNSAVEQLTIHGQAQVAAISIQNWFNGLLENSCFKHTGNVIVLLWENTAAVPEAAVTDVSIRPMMLEDMDEVEHIDHAAFGMIWKNSHESLELAFQQSSLATVAELSDEIVGYQFSTSSIMGGHLARLAVKPQLQGKGIGYYLVNQVLAQFRRQGVMHVTVNTQEDNSASLAIYKKAGFTLTGESYRVYTFSLTA